MDLKNVAYLTNMLYSNLDSPKKYKPFCFKAFSFGLNSGKFMRVFYLFLSIVLCIEFECSSTTQLYLEPIIECDFSFLLQNAI